jgi:endonuclease/exonuclease/phosphatase family metal-dependent hydrolase
MTGDLPGTAGGKRPALRDRRGTPPGRFDALTLNLRFGLAEDGPNSWPQRRAAVRRLLENHCPDFACFQEANGFQVDYLADVLPTHGCIGRRFPAPAFWQNNVIFYHRRWHCRDYAHFFLSPTPEIPSRSRASRGPRQCTMGFFEAGAKRLVVVNAHFDFEASVQVESAHIILDRLEGFAGQAPVILLGDFNAPPGSACHAAFTREPGGPTRKCFSHVFAPPYPGTFHGFSGTHGGAHIDWILYRGGLSLLAGRVIHQRFAGRYVSDHFPVAASFA